MYRIIGMLRYVCYCMYIYIYCITMIFMLLYVQVHVHKRCMYIYIYNVVHTHANTCLSMTLMMDRWLDDAIVVTTHAEEASFNGPRPIGSATPKSLDAGVRFPTNDGNSSGWPQVSHCLEPILTRYWFSRESRIVPVIAYFNRSDSMIAFKMDPRMNISDQDWSFRFPQSLAMSKTHHHRLPTGKALWISWGVAEMPTTFVPSLLHCNLYGVRPGEERATRHDTCHANRSEIKD